MKETGAIFTGEMSGHMFFADDYYGFDDALYAAARLLLLLSNSKQTISEMLSDTAKYYATPEIRLPSDDKSKFQLVELILMERGLSFHMAGDWYGLPIPVRKLFAAVKGTLLRYWII
jgi:phosphomannomutase